jgi:capsular polysaccharide biosynthesis protein
MGLVSKNLIERYLRHFKKRVVSYLQSTSVSSEIIGPPKGVVHSTKDWVANYNVKSKKKALYQEVISSCHIQRRPPLTLDESIHWKFRGEYKEARSPMFVATIPQGRVWGNAGAVITPDDYLLGQVSREFFKTSEENSVFYQFKLARPKRIRGRAAVLATAGGRTYFHWMCDILPRIHLLKLARQFDSINYFIINSYQFPFHKETLQILGIPESKIIYSTNHWMFHIKADELIVPSLPAKLDTVTRWSCDFLQRTFLKPLLNQYLKKRLYISRRSAPNRKLIDEEEVLKILIPKGFEVIMTEGMSVQDQAQLFAQAEWVIAPHGAGLTNLVFCQPGTQVIDIFSPNWVNPCYWILSQEMGLVYHYIIGKGKAPPEFIDPVGKSDDVNLNLNDLIKTIEKVGFSM